MIEIGAGGGSKTPRPWEALELIGLGLLHMPYLRSMQIFPSYLKVAVPLYLIEEVVSSLACHTQGYRKRNQCITKFFSFSRILLHVIKFLEAIYYPLGWFVSLIIWVIWIYLEIVYIYIYIYILQPTKKENNWSL